MICPQCRRRYVNPMKFHRHLLQELREVTAEFIQLVNESKLRWMMIDSLSRKIVAQEVRT